MNHKIISFNSTTGIKLFNHTNKKCYLVKNKKIDIIKGKSLIKRNISFN